MSTKTDLIFVFNTNPGVNNDSANGYLIGAEWYNSATGELFELIDDSVGAAVWESITKSYDWAPTAITLGDGATVGANLILAVGAGYYINFNAGADNEFVCSVGLRRNGKNYDGSNLQIQLNWMPFGVPAGGNTVLWELDYYFANDGSNSYTGTDGTVTNSVDVSGRTSQIQYTDSLPVISGPAGSTHLQFTLRRNSTGVGADTYAGDAEVYGINLIKP